MKRQLWFIGLMMVFGVVLAIATMMTLAAIAVPSYNNLILTPEEKTSFELMEKNFGWFMKEQSKDIFLWSAFFITGIASILLLINLNPNLKIKSLKAIGWKGGFKAVIMLGTSLMWLALLISLSQFLGKPVDYSIEFFLLTAVGTGVLWFIVGETGWAGDFSSWGMGVQGKKPKPIAGFLMGAVTGSIVYGLFYLANQVYLKQFFPLVSEVWDKSGETSYLGFKLFTYGLVFVFSVLLGIIAGIITILSPTYKETEKRLREALLPVSLFVVSAVICGVIYQNGVTKYDLGKKNLAEALGVPEKASISKTVILFQSDKKQDLILQDWPMEAASYSFMGGYTTEVSYDSLKKAKDYIEKHKQGSVFNYAAREMLVNGYLILWDIKDSLKEQFKSSESIILHRLMMLHRLRFLPVTGEHLEYLKSYADETRWHVGSSSALKIAEGFMHFGMPKEAKTWLNKAKEKDKDLDISQVKIEEETLTKGKITGRITINSKVLPNTKAAILRHTGPLTFIDRQNINSKLLDAQDTASDGSFSFSNLGSGEYILAIMTEKQTIPSDLPIDKIAAENQPGLIKLDLKTKSQNLGDINLTTK